MPIYVNGKKIKGETITFDSFKEKCFQMAKDKGITIHIDSGIERTLLEAYDKLDYKMVVDSLEVNQMKWG